MSSTQTLVPSGSKGGVSRKIYASIGRRFFALLIDRIVLFLCSLLLFPVLLGFVFLMPPVGFTVPNLFLPWGLFLILDWVYYASFESSARGATPGKRLLGLRVTDMDGLRLSFRRASVRYFSKIISTFPLMLGFVMAFFTEKHQALHDLLAETVVLKARH